MLLELGMHVTFGIYTKIDIYNNGSAVPSQLAAGE
jgi:hypothetical protein